MKHKQKLSGDLAQGLECLLSMSKALSSIPSVKGKISLTTVYVKVAIAGP
jgi:hypothetical protein